MCACFDVFLAAAEGAQILAERCGTTLVTARFGVSGALARFRSSGLCQQLRAVWCARSKSVVTQTDTSPFPRSVATQSDDQVSIETTDVQVGRSDQWMPGSLLCLKSARAMFSSLPQGGSVARA